MSRYRRPRQPSRRAGDRDAREHPARRRAGRRDRAVGVTDRLCMSHSEVATVLVDLNQVAGVATVALVVLGEGRQDHGDARGQAAASGTCCRERRSTQP